MNDQELAEKLKENLEKIKGVSNIRLHPGVFRGKEQKEAYLEYRLASQNFEENSIKLYSIISRRIRNNFQNISIDYVKPDIINNEVNLRRIVIHVEGELKSNKKEQLIRKVVQEFNNIIENYLLRK